MNSASGAGAAPTSQAALAGKAGTRLCGARARSVAEAFNSPDLGFERKGGGPDLIFEVGLSFQGTGSRVRSSLSLSVLICRMGQWEPCLSQSLEDAWSWSVLLAGLNQSPARDRGSVGVPCRQNGNTIGRAQSK